MSTKGKFVVKTAEEIQALIEGEKFEELAEYYNQKNDQTRIELTGLIEAKATKEDIQKASDAIREDMVKQMHNLNEAMKAQGIAIKQFARSKKDDQPTTFKAAVKEALSEKIDQIKSLRGLGFVDLEVKAVGDMTIAGNVSGGNVPVEDRIDGLNTIASRRIRFLDVLMKSSTTSQIVSWVYQSGKEGAAGGTTEGTAKNQIDFDLVVDSETTKKRTAYIKVSDEMLDDIAWINSEINNELMRELLKDVESQAYEGDGTGNNLNGVLTTATAFAAGTFATAIDNANFVDVLTVAANQIAIADQDPPNYIFMHPSDVTTLKVTKLSSTDKRYVDRLIQTGMNLSLDGIPIIPTTLVTVDKYLIGNFSLAHLVTRDSIRIEMGLDADDFTKNMRTIRAEWRGLTYVKNNDRTAFVTGDFSTDIAALETP